MSIQSIQIIEQTPTRLVLKQETNIINATMGVVAFALIPGILLCVFTSFFFALFWVVFFLVVAAGVVFYSPSMEIWIFDRQMDRMTEQKQKLMEGTTEKHIPLSDIEHAYVEETFDSAGDLIGWNAMLRLHTGTPITLMNIGGGIPNRRKAYEKRKELVDIINRWLGV
jgi:hypothetical protein